MTAPTPERSHPAPGRQRPTIVPLVGVALGVAMLLVSWLAADAPGIGLAMLAIMLSYAAVMRYGQRFESVQLLSHDPPLDERHALIQQRALAAAYFAVLGVALIGFFWEIARGAPGAFTLICFVGGLTHMIATVILRRRS
ncbi:hypothetical protein [Billgrantia gudaonensis]|uniref:DUF2178 domain-containing protein n=1 Tax=Billgrantia gudaonensis TaxID=376427 RepID=A0A1G8R7L9_9GAMM|nr:hypothetical protein [Halomonas gudaonensis]SDJ12390.1 hypothetical protein SAMN04487954_103110 [Halomonas gudaonensis]